MKQQDEVSVGGTAFSRRMSAFTSFSSASASSSKAIEMEDVKFHQCVRLSRFENDRTISFIPPDGDFELMSYRLQTSVKPLIWVEAVVENYAGSRVEYMVKAKAQFKRKSSANNVEIAIPVPDDADSPKFKVMMVNFATQNHENETYVRVFAVLKWLGFIQA